MEVHLDWKNKRFEKYLGWVGVDPTCGDLVRGKHIAVATSQRPDQLPPVAGSFMGPSQTHSTLEVSVSAQFVDS